MDEVLAEDLEVLRRAVKKHDDEIQKLILIMQGIIEVLKTTVPNAKIS